MNKKILIIDDDDAIVDAITTALKLRKYQVVGLTDAKKALTVALRTEPDLILLDFMLSGTDGKSVALKLKSNSHLNSVPIIIISAQNDIHDLIDKVGVREILPKPFSLTDLWNVVEKHVN